MADSIWKRSKRWRWFAGIVAVLAIAGVLAVPFALGTSPGRRWLIRRANRAIAPATMQMSSMQFSWFSGTKITNLVLVDAQGDRVVDAPRANWDRNLWQILFDPARVGTLELEDAALDVERLPDGSVDLYESLKPILKTEPDRQLTIKVENGRLRFRSPHTPSPVLSEDTDILIVIVPAPTPLSWHVSLSNSAPTVGGEALETFGQFDQWNASSDLHASVKGTNWPWTFGSRELTASGRLDGEIAIQRAGGYWSTIGKTVVDDIDVAGQRLRDDHLRLPHVTGSWDVAQSAEGWNIRQLLLRSAIASVNSGGFSEDSGHIEGIVDLAALTQQLPHALHLRDGVAIDKGAAVIRANLEKVSERRSWRVEAKLSDLAARDRNRSFKLKAPATVRARIDRIAEGLQVDEVSVETAFLAAKAQGNPAAGVKWSGTIDLEAFQTQLRELIEFGSVELKGKGTFSGDYRASNGRFEVRTAAGLGGLKVAGIGPGTIERDAANFALDAAGTPDDLGLPQSLEKLTAKLASGSANANVTATRRGDALEIAATTELPLSTGKDGRALKGHVESRWSEKQVAIDLLELVVAATEPAAKAEPIRFAARGSFDREAGELILKAGPQGPTADLVTLGPDGLRASGLGTPGKLRVRAALTGDTRALFALVAPDHTDVGGNWTAITSVRPSDDAIQIAADFRMDDPTRSTSVRGDATTTPPFALALNAVYQPKTDGLQVAELVAKSRFGTAEAAGTISHLSTQRIVDAHSTVTVDWKTVSDLLARRLEPNANVSGKPLSFRVKGPLGSDSTDWSKDLDADLLFDAFKADVYGMKVGPTPIAMHWKAAKGSVDPIDAMINGGRMHLEPEIVQDESGDWVLRLGQESWIKQARINDEVSRRVLSFVAPVLESATRVHGEVSVSLKAAEFPLEASRSDKTKVEGSVDFKDVEFVPGPLTDDLFALVGAQRGPTLKLDEPVSMTIADRKVIQRGFAIPIGRATRIELAGWVDFDRNLALKASLPLTPAMVGNLGILGDIVEGTRISVPIGGTLQQPKIDRDAFKQGLADLGKTLLQRSAGVGAAELLMRLTRPRDPNAPPALTPEQRREQRMERREERRVRRQGRPALGQP